MRARIGRGPLLLLLVVTMIVARPVLGVAGVRQADDRPALPRELARVAGLVDDTVAAVADGRETGPVPGTGDPTLVDRIGGDHPTPPGYDQCDSWRDWILPGWQASYGRTIRVRDSREGDEILRAAERFWAGQVQDAASIRRETDPGNGQQRLMLDRKHASYWLTVAPERGASSLLAGPPASRRARSVGLQSAPVA